MTIYSRKGSHDVGCAPIVSSKLQVHRGFSLGSRLLRVLMIVAMVRALLFVAPVGASADEDVSPPELTEFSFTQDRWIRALVPLT